MEKKYIKKILVLTIVFIILLLINSIKVKAANIPYRKDLGTLKASKIVFAAASAQSKESKSDYWSGQGFCRAKANNKWYYICAMVNDSRLASYLYIIDENGNIKAKVADYYYGHTNAIAYNDKTGEIYISKTGGFAVLNKNFIKDAMKKVKNLKNPIIKNNGDNFTQNHLRFVEYQKDKTIPNIVFDLNGDMYISNKAMFCKLDIKTKKENSKLNINLNNDDKVTDAGIMFIREYMLFSRWNSNTKQSLIDVFYRNGNYVGTYKIDKSYGEIEGISYNGNQIISIYCNIYNNKKYTMKIYNIDLGKAKMITIEIKNKKVVKELENKKNLTITLLNEKKKVIRSKIKIGESKIVNLKGLSKGTYYIKICYSKNKESLWKINIEENKLYKKINLV